jgi:N-acetylmuramoyl-L-alanine amidase
MRYRMLTWWLIFISFSFSLVAWAEQAVYLEGLLIQPSTSDTRLTFILSDKTYGKVKYIPNPDRLIIEFDHTYKRFNLENTRLGNANVKTINTEQMGLGTLRFIFTLTGKVHWKTTFLPTSPNSGTRFELEIISDKPVSLHSNNLQTIFQTDIAHAESNINELIGRALLDEQKKVIAVNKQRIYTIVLDAGHGGKDPGALGARGTEEKQVVLNIAKILADKINQQPGMRAVLTRHGDYFVPLRQRLNLARKGKADLFVAIHADAYFEKNATGASVYALSQHGASNEATRWLAQRENYSELGEVALNALQDRDPMLRSVLVDLAQTATIQDSMRLGNKILDALDRVSSLHYTHVERAPFVVLKSPDIPSILVETGFITNPFEEERLASSVYQEQMAQALLLGVQAYVQKYAVKDE